jgi:hypothetical protein
VVLFAADQARHLKVEQRGLKLWITAAQDIDPERTVKSSRADTRAIGDEELLGLRPPFPTEN